jgi:hypothetical protein
MTGLFSLAVERAMRMSERKPDPIRIQAGPFNIAIPMAGGGLSSVHKNLIIQGQPHELSYITPNERDLLQELGGLGKPVEGTGGIPAYIGVGDADGLGEDYGIGGSMGGGFGDDGKGMDEDSRSTGKSAAYTDPNIDPTGPGSAWGIETGPALGTSWLDTFLSFLTNKLAAATPFGMVPNIMSHVLTGRSLGEHAFGAKDLSQLGTEKLTGWLGGKSRSEYDHMDPDEMDIDIHDVDHPSFDEDTMSEEDLLYETKDKKEDDDTKYKAIITKLFDEEEEEEEEQASGYSDILKDMYGDDIDQTGLPDILEQAYGRRGSV